MKSLYQTITKYSAKFFVRLWDFAFFFLGCPYEKQATKLKLDKFDPTITGPKNEKTSHQFYRATKVSNKR